MTTRYDLHSVLYTPGYNGQGEKFSSIEEGTNIIFSELFSEFFPFVWLIACCLQSLNNQLCVMSKEKDKLVTQIEEQQKHAIEEESLNKRYNDLVGHWKVLVFSLAPKLFESFQILMNLLPVNGGKVSSGGTEICLICLLF